MRTLKAIKYLRLILLLTSVSASSVFGQTKNERVGGVGIGTTKPDQSAILDLSSTSKGLLLPRMTLTERSSIINPASGLLIYQTNMLNGVYVYDGNNWSLVNNGGNSSAKLQANEETTWGTRGNTGLNSALHFIGTTDTTSLQFKINNISSGIIDYKRGMSSFGFKAGFLSRGYNSVIMGALAMQKSNTGGNNVAIGYQTLLNNEQGDHNVAIGSGSLAANSKSEKNTAIGSLSGYKSSGSGNVFIGFQAGYFETLNNKLHISNDASRASLIYGDFETARVGINTTTLTNAFTINSGTANKSGLSFEKLNSNSSVNNGNGKVLTLSNTGEVILVNDYFEPKGANGWQINGNDLVNSNAGKVFINRDAIIGGQLNANSIVVGSNALTINGLGDATNKFLSLDASGKVKLVNAPSSTTSSTTGGSSSWDISNNDLTNNNSGLVSIANGLRFGNLSSNSQVGNSNGKVLSIDSNGKVILVNDEIGTTTASASGDSGFWSLDSQNRITNTDRKVRMKGNLDVEGTLFTTGVFTRGLGVADYGLKFMTMNKNSTAQASNGKALSLDDEGYVILTNAGSGASTTVTDGFWKTQNGAIVTENNEKVVIGAGITNLPDGFNLYVKKGILAERVRVAVANSDKWADYVFDRNYNLMPIKDVAKFIEVNKHLPNVPSAEEVAANGIDMAEIAAKQMEKIEELTLYLIQANERIEKLEKQVQAIKK